MAGIDLSRTTDLTAASLIIEKDGKNYVITKFFMPRERFKVAINEENVPYNIFEQQGFLKISGEHQVDYKDVLNWFIELVKVYKIKPLKVGYDRYCAGYLVQEMKEAGFHMDDVYQGTNLTPVLHTFDLYLFFMREAFIHEMNQTKEGRNYLENCWRISQTEPDRKAIREKFKRRGGE